MYRICQFHYLLSKNRRFFLAKMSCLCLLHLNLIYSLKLTLYRKQRNSMNETSTNTSHNLKNPQQRHKKALTPCLQMIQVSTRNSDENIICHRLDSVSEPMSGKIEFKLSPLTKAFTIITVTNFHFSPVLNQ